MTKRPDVPVQPRRPLVAGTRHAVSAAHYLATQAAFQVLEAGGNAIDAGVAGGLALNVVECDYASLGGVAPIMVHMAERRETVTIDGLGTWPAAVRCEEMRRLYGDEVPRGILRTVVPAAVDAWLTALERYGTMTFAEVAREAVRLARDGFAMYDRMADILASQADSFRGWSENARILLPGGRAPRVGEIFRQPDLAATLERLAAAERKAGGSRAAGVRAARDAFYKGEVAHALADFQRAQGGLLTADDLARYSVTVEAPLRVRFCDLDLAGCGPWCQGPMLLQALAVLDGIDLAALGHNSAAYIHTVVEAIKLAAADREAYYGDPKFVAVPAERLISPEYAARRRALIRPQTAWPVLPPPGGPADGLPGAGAVKAVARAHAAIDTSYICVVDRWGNAFSATPSDGVTGAPIVPGTGIAASMRGGQSWTDPTHPSAIAPGKRPRLTPNPAIAFARDGSWIMPFGTPGHDTQTQVMLQVLINAQVFGMDLQSAVEAPRFATLSFPSSSMPHGTRAGLLDAEEGIGDDVIATLRGWGHDAQRWPAAGPRYQENLSSACMARAHRSGIREAAADPRRPAYAAAW